MSDNIFDNVYNPDVLSWLDDLNGDILCRVAELHPACEVDRHFSNFLTFQQVFVIVYLLKFQQVHFRESILSRSTIWR